MADESVSCGTRQVEIPGRRDAYSGRGRGDSRGGRATSRWWLAARPTGPPTERFVGELCGDGAGLLFSCALVLATLLPAIERAFSGFDRVAVWHRRTATVGALLLNLHWVLATSTPDRYATGVGPGLGDVAPSSHLVSWIEQETSLGFSL